MTIYIYRNDLNHGLIEHNTQIFSFAQAAAWKTIKHVVNNKSTRDVSEKRQQKTSSHRGEIKESKKVLTSPQYALHQHPSDWSWIAHVILYWVVAAVIPSSLSLCIVAHAGLQNEIFLHIISMEVFFFLKESVRTWTNFWIFTSTRPTQMHDFFTIMVSVECRRITSLLCLWCDLMV